jgi:hypothetical protein
MKKQFVQLIVGCILLIPTLALSASDKAQEKIDYEIFKAQTQAKLEALKEEKNQEAIAIKGQVEKELGIQNAKIDVFDKRIGDLNLYLTIFGVLVAIVAFWTADRRSEKTTKITAEKWFKDNENDLLKQIKDLKAKLKDHADAAHLQIDAAIAIIKNKNINTELPDQKLPTFSEAEQQTLNQANTTLQQKPEAQYTFDDWNTRAYAAYANGDFYLASEYWQFASQAHDAKEYQKANACFSASVTLQEKLNNHNSAIPILDSLIARFGNSHDQRVELSVAAAYYNKAVAFGELGATEAETSVIDELISKFGNTSNLAVQTIVGDGWQHKVFHYIQKIKKNWDGNASMRKEGLQGALRIFEELHKKPSRPYSEGLILFSIAYTSYLLGKTREPIKSKLSEALKLGKQELYDDVIKEIEIYPIANDKAFRKLLDEVWKEAKDA